MLSCETCCSQMLEYLYDLLEASERQAWEEHLKDCASCQVELAQAATHRQLLAQAAKMNFANVSFAPPATIDRVLTQNVGTRSTIRMGAKSPRPWRRWLAAAAVLLAVGLAGVVGWYGRDYRNIEETVAQAENRIEQAKKDRLEAEQQLARLQEQKQERIAAIHKTQRDSQLQVEVQGPAALRVGAPTDYRIYTRDLNNRQLTSAKVSIEVKDHGQTIAKPLAVAGNKPGDYRLTLPPDLPVRSDSQPTLFVSARRDDGSEVELSEELQLAAPVYITHLEIDKPIYHFGDTVRFRSLTLDRFSLKPAEQDLKLQFFLATPGSGNRPRLIAQGRTSLVEEGANGVQPVLGPDGKPLHGIGAGSFQLDAEGPDGEYALIVREVNRRFPEQRRKFFVHKDEKPKPGTIAPPIPIDPKKLDVEFCPEGGDLVAGLRNRVYFQVRNSQGKPADLQGQLLEDGKPLDVAVKTLASEKTPELNQGMGRFEFTPKVGRKYELKIETPAGIAKLFELPPIKPEGVVLSVDSDVVKAGETIPVTVRSTAKRSFLVGAYCRGRLLDSAEFTGEEGHVVLRPASGAGGVCRVTVFEILPGEGSRRSLRPVAERLIYRQPAERVHLTLKPDQESYVPRQTVKLNVEATNEKGEPASAVVLLRVIDKSVAALAGDKTQRGMPTHFLLTTEVRRPEDLEYADFLLGPHPQAAEALDLLLGTQGWRRFAEQNPSKFRREQKQEAERLLVTLGHSPIRMTDLMQQKLQRVETEHARQSEELAVDVAQIKKVEQEARNDQDYRAALVKLKTYDDFFDRTKHVGTPIIEAILVSAALVCLILGLFRRLIRALPYYAATVACVAMVLLLMRVSLWNAPPRHVGEEQIAELTERENRQISPNAKAGQAQPKAADQGVGRRKARPLTAPRPNTVADRTTGLPNGIAQRLLDRTKQATQPEAGRATMPKSTKDAALPPNAWPPMPVREYKHMRAAGSADERHDFAETLYWHPVLVLPGGKTEVSLDLSDSLGAFEVTAFAHTLDGRLGSATQTFHTQKSQTGSR